MCGFFYLKIQQEKKVDYRWNIYRINPIKKNDAIIHNGFFNSSFKIHLIQGITFSRNIFINFNIIPNKTSIKLFHFFLRVHLLKKYARKSWFKTTKLVGWVGSVFIPLRYCALNSPFWNLIAQPKATDHLLPALCVLSLTYLTF